MSTIDPHKVLAFKLLPPIVFFKGPCAILLSLVYKMRGCIYVLIVFTCKLKKRINQCTENAIGRSPIYVLYFGDELIKLTAVVNNMIIYFVP